MPTALVKSLSRLTRDNLIDLALKWLEHDQACQPYLASNRTLNESDEEDYLHAPAEGVDELKRKYISFRGREKEVSKRDIVDRIVDGDWRRGLSLEQVAMIDFAYLEQNDSCLRWSALKLAPLQNIESCQPKFASTKSSKRRKLHHQEAATLPKYPSIQPATFVDALRSHISPLVKAYVYLHRLPQPTNLPIVRLYITSNTAFTPNSSKTTIQNDKSISEAGRVMYIALPSSCPYVYISLSGSAATSLTTGTSAASKPSASLIDLTATKRIILEAIPKALSKPQQRWAVESTKLTTKSLKSMIELRGNQKPGTGGGAYSRFTEGDDQAELYPTNPQLPLTPPASTQNTPEPETQPSSTSGTTSEQEKQIQRRNQVYLRFGSQKGPHYAPLDRVRIKIEDLFQPPNHKSHKMQQATRRRVEDSAPLEITFSGTDVFGGLCALAELHKEYIDLDRLPSKLTGEEGCSGLIL